jgi:phosphatidylglycerophosphate synthase
MRNAISSTGASISTSQREFRESARELNSLLSSLEKRCLLWMAARLPPWISSDHLTALALLAMLGCAWAYWLARTTPAGLWLASLCLVANWFGDSLDGTLARVRNRQRPRYGFYVDHIVDVFGATALFAGLALSGFMTPGIALALLIAYLLVSIEIYLATYCLGTFRISFLRMGPTELRLLLVAGNLALWHDPSATILGRTYLLYDVGGVIGIVGLAAAAVICAARNTRRLYQEERLGA